MSCKAFEAELCSRGLLAVEVDAVRVTIHGASLRDAGESLGVSHECVRLRLKRAAGKLGVAMALFVAVGESGRGDNAGRYARAGGEWHGAMTWGKSTVKLTEREAELEAWADRIIADGVRLPG